MSTSKFIPTSDPDKVVWLNNFTTKLSTNATLLGFTTAEITALQKDNAYFAYLITTIELLRQNLLNFVGYKNLTKYAKKDQHNGALPTLPSLGTTPPAVTEGIFERAAKLAGRAKLSLNYTDPIGADLGIISPSSTVDVSLLQPELKIKIDVGKPHVRWIKGYSDALDLYVNRDDGLGYVLVGRFTRNEYLDVTALAPTKVFDEWNYKGIYVIADTPIGLYSNIVSVDVKKM